MDKLKEDEPFKITVTMSRRLLRSIYAKDFSLPADMAAAITDDRLQEHMQHKLFNFLKL